MGRFLNIGLIQGTGTDMSFEKCIANLEKNVSDLMAGMNRPELVIGTEMAIGRYFNVALDKTLGHTIPGQVTKLLSDIAKKYGIYFIPGSMIERTIEHGKAVVFNTAPIFNPDGELIDSYRKICPYYPAPES